MPWRGRGRQPSAARMPADMPEVHLYRGVLALLEVFIGRSQRIGRAVEVIVRKHGASALRRPPEAGLAFHRAPAALAVRRVNHSHARQSALARLRQRGSDDDSQRSGVVATRSLRLVQVDAPASTFRP